MGRTEMRGYPLSTNGLFSKTQEKKREGSLVVVVEAAEMWKIRFWANVTAILQERGFSKPVENSGPLWNLKKQSTGRCKTYTECGIFVKNSVYKQSAGWSMENSVESVEC